MKRLLLLLLFILIRGETVYAVNVMLDVVPGKAFYHPGESVSLLVSASGGDSVSARVTYLAEAVAELSAPVVDGSAVLEWTPPPLSPRGYGLDVDLLDGEGAVLASTSTAFDVLERWTQAPRYGFLTDYLPNRTDPDMTMAWATRYHLNGLQFYDWQYRHETLLPPESSDLYSDLLGRNMSLNVVRDLIDAAHRYNIAAMPYTAIYGASPAFYEQHPEMGLYRAPNLPYIFGNNYLYIMNPSPDSLWTAHLLNEYARVLDETDFDGIHIDTYGAPMRGRSASGEVVRLDEVFPTFINATAELVEDRRGEDGATIFNAVRNLSIETVAPSDQDVVYIEVWEPYRSFLDLYRIVAQAQQLGGGKPVVIAAYISPAHAANVRLANAIIFASGGYYLQLGEPGALLADPYFPNFGLMDEAMQSRLRRYFDFMVRYENVLSLDTHDATAERADALSIDGIITQSSRSSDRVAVLVRQSEDTSREAFSLINLLGIDGEYWDAPLTQAPTPVQDLQVHLATARPVARLYAASPDGDDLSAIPIEFTAADDGINFGLSRLDYWTVLIVEYAS